MTSARVEAAPRTLGPGWWAVLAAVVAIGLAGNWILAAGVLAFLVAQAASPLAFLTSYLIVIAGASFVANQGGGLTIQLSLLTGAILFMLFCYSIECYGRIFSISRAPLALPLSAFLVLTVANAVRGLLAGYSPRYWGLELMPILALGSALLVANAFDPRRHLRLAIAALVLLAFGPAIQGFHVFSIVRGHTGSVYTIAEPGIAGLLLVNLALRARGLTSVFGFTLLSLPLFLHQFLSFGRGLWTGCLAALVVSVAAYAGAGRGSAVRWRRAGLVLLLLVMSGVAGAFQMALFFDQMDILREAGTRFTSITGTQINYENRSNLIRVGEYTTVARLILESPWIGRGVGYAYPLRQIFTRKTHPQWWVHQNYLFVWLKQGIIGLVLFVWMLGTATMMGVREARRRADWLESAWFATAAGATVFLAVLALSNFPFAVVNQMFFLALLWGGCMAMIPAGRITLAWTPPAAPEQGIA